MKLADQRVKIAILIGYSVGFWCGRCKMSFNQQPFNVNRTSTNKKKENEKRKSGKNEPWKLFEMTKSWEIWASGSVTNTTVIIVLFVWLMEFYKVHVDILIHFTHAAALLLFLEGNGVDLSLFGRHLPYFSEDKS